ncbi:hypothetical protein J1N35_017906 [Gossypium stocksii]|uniref:Uncharacterized protein n=1 Tax=Gossypium stocksii TaxID=47602 RepID=A0A9D3VNC2_9ROSI|nr:hypothetical protein J1N35_017906 [Gossypium stocksii]
MGTKVELGEMMMTTKNRIDLCTDVAVKAVSETTLAGGVLKYGNGDWIMGYNRFLGQNLTVFENVPRKVLAIAPIVKASVSLVQNSCM